MKKNYTYIIGFNAGYLLGKYKQALISKLAPSLTKAHEYLIGLQDGKEEYELEIKRGRLDELDKLRTYSRDDYDRDL
jgi:hypothetical protein